MDMNINIFCHCANDSTKLTSKFQPSKNKKTKVGLNDDDSKSYDQYWNEIHKGIMDQQTPRKPKLVVPAVPMVPVPVFVPKIMPPPPHYVLMYYQPVYPNSYSQQYHRPRAYTLPY
jgi:hypothetical protein